MGERSTPPLKSVDTGVYRTSAVLFCVPNLLGL
jgi:hypothetical protein